MGTESVGRPRRKRRRREKGVYLFVFPLLTDSQSNQTWGLRIRSINLLLVSMYRDFRTSLAHVYANVSPRSTAASKLPSDYTHPQPNLLGTAQLHVLLNRIGTLNGPFATK